MKVIACAKLHSCFMLPALLVTLLLSPLQGKELAPDYFWLYPDAFFGELQKENSVFIGYHHDPKSFFKKNHLPASLALSVAFDDFLGNLNASGMVPDPAVEYMESSAGGCGTGTMYPSPLNASEQSAGFTACGVGSPAFRGLDESYMAVVGGDYTVPAIGGAEIEGRVAIGGNLVVEKQYALSESGGGTFSIGAAGDAASVGGTVSGAGPLSLGINNSGENYNIVSGGVNTVAMNNGVKVENSGSLPVDVSALLTQATCASTNMKDATATGSSNFAFGTGTLTGTNAALEIFNLAGGDLDPGFQGTATFADGTIAAGATIVINVSGTSVDLKYALSAGRINDPNNTGDLDALVYNVVWNFYEATNLTLSATTNGMVLAPLADITVITNLNGRVYTSGNLVHSGSGTEIHNSPFTGDLSSFCTAAPVNCSLDVTQVGSQGDCSSGGTYDIVFTVDWVDAPTTGDFEVTFNGDAGTTQTITRTNLSATASSEMVTLSGINCLTSIKYLEFGFTAEACSELVNYISGPIDPAGYIYCVETGEIVRGGTISITPPSGGSTIIPAGEDGSTGHYIWYADGFGNYTMSYNVPAGYVAVAMPAPGDNYPLDTDDVFDSTPGSEDNPGGDVNTDIFLGSPATGTTLDDNAAVANPFFLEFEISHLDDPFIYLNNIPITSSISTITAVASGCNTANNQYTLDVTVEWTNAPAADMINVMVGGQTLTIDTDAETSPTTMQFILDSDGSTDNVASANFASLSDCGRETTYDAPASCFTSAFAMEVLSNGPVCPDEQLLLNARVTAPPFGVVFTYSWTGPGAFTSTEANPSITGYTDGMHNGTYNVTVTNTSNSDQAIGFVTVATDNVSCVGQDCVSSEFLYLNDDGADFVHKFQVMPNGDLIEVGSPWFSNSAILDSPHGVAMDPNGFLYINSLLSNTTVKFDCDGNVLENPTATVSSLGHVIVGNYLFATTQAVPEHIQVFSLCDGNLDEVGYVDLGDRDDANFSDFPWGIVYNTLDGMIYVTEGEGGADGNGAVYMIDPSNPEDVGSVWQTNATIPPILSGLNSIAGIAFDSNNFMYLAGDEDTPNQTFVRKYEFITGTWTQVGEITDATFDNVGFGGGRGLTYSTSTDLIYLGSFEDCVAIIDPDPFAYVRPGIGVVPGSSAKATGIVTEGCYRGANPIDVTVCTDADPIVLRDLIGCNVCGGDWTRTDGNAGGTYDACNRTFDPTGNTAGASFTFAGNNDLCGAFNIVVNITYATTTATASTTQATCNGNTASNDAELILTAASNATHYNFVAGSDYEADGGNTDIINATAFDPATDLPLTLANTLPNPSGSQDYTIRVFNNLSSCFEDVTVTLDEMSCVVTNCSLTIDDVTINCTNNTNFTVDATLSWDFADLPTTNELIDVTFDGATMTIDPASMATGTGMVSFTSMQPDYALPITANFASTTTCSASTLIDLIACTPDCVNGPGTLGGNVFNDFNNDGADAGPGEVGQANVLVEVYDCDGVLVCSTWTNADGNWTCPDLNDIEEYRVEFSAPLQPYLQPSFAGDDNGTNTQFVTAPSCEVDYGVVDATDYCQENPDLAIPCYVTGPADGNDPGLIGFDYEMGGFFTLASTAELGTSWGLALQRMGNTIYTSAYLKRYAGLSQGLGHIFMTNPVTGFAGSFDLNGVNGIDVGTVDRTSGPDFVLNADGFSRDLDAFAKIGRVGYGDMDIYEDEQLFVVNLNAQTIITIDVSDPSALPTDGSMINTALVTEHTLALPSCSGGVMRPFALNIHEDRGYIGVVCDASISESTSDLRAYVFSFDPANPSGLLAEEISFALDYTREPAGVFTGAPDFPSTWLPWVNTWDDLEKVQYDNGFGNRWYINHHAPFVADIEFADDGGMIIGLGDRAGDQFGFDNLVPLPASQPINPGLATVFNGGDLLKACYIDGGYTLEGGSADCAVSDLNPNNVLTLNTDGPSGVGEFFYADVFGTTQGHAEISLGAVAFLSGNNEVVAAIYDPEDFNSQGVARYSTVDGSRTDFLTIVTGAAQTFGKANGLGDLELLCDPLPIQIGNFVWIDTDMDGVQDACEEPVSNLPVSLYNKVTMMFAGVDTTDTNGNYYFSNVNPDTEYAIVFGYDANDMNSPWDATTMELTLGGNTYGLTMADTGEGNNEDFNDSDATVMDMAGLTGYPIISYTTADTTDHTLDVGLTPAAGLTLGSTVFHDNNNDGMQNGADTGIANVEVQLFDIATGLQVLTDANGVRVVDVADAATVVTDPDGNYIFSDLPPGDYYVVIPTAPATAPISSNDAGSGFMETDPDDNADNDDEGLQTGGSGTIVSSDTITLSSGDEPLNQADGGTEGAQGNMQDDADDANGNMTLDFGFFAPASLGDTTFVDVNENGLQEADEPELAGVTVTLFDSATGMQVTTDAEGNAITGTTMTNAMGFYEFTNLSPGNYYVVFDLSTVPGNEFIEFTSTSGGNETDDSDADPTTGQTENTGNIASGERFPDLDAGVICTVAAEAGDPQTVCSTVAIDLTGIGASITPDNVAGFGATWTTSGDGTFDDGNAGVFGAATSYTLGASEIAAGQVILTLTTDDPMAAPFNSVICGPVSDDVIITILRVDCGSFNWDGSND